MTDQPRDMGRFAGQAGDAEGLSPAGRARRDAMLGQLLHEASRMHLRRRATRIIGALSLLLLASAGAWWGLAFNAGSRGAPDRVAELAPPDQPAPRETAGKPESRDLPRWSLVRTDPEVAQRLTVLPGATAVAIASAGTSRIQFVGPSVAVHCMNDAELAQALADIGQPATIARSQGRVWLIALNAGDDAPNL